MRRDPARAAARGRSIVIVGPDGAGKSALAGALIDRLGGPEHVVHVHLRSPILPRRTRHTGPVTEPHARPPYGTITAAAKTAWLFADMQAMWRIVVPWTLRAGRDVVVERGWWDLAVDPRRYRLRGPDAARRLATLFPSPSLEVILTGPARILAERKPELPLEEIDRQSRAWRSLRPAGPGVLHLDADRPIEELVEAVLGHPVVRGPVDGVVSAVRLDRRLEDRWVRLPPVGTTSWHIPRTPRAAAVGGLRVYHPMTLRGGLAWGLARAVALVGGFWLLPGHDADDAVAPIAASSPPDSTFAVAVGRRPGRTTVLVMDRGGHAIALAKTATDDGGRSRLAHEASAGDRFRDALTAPLSSPRVLSRGEDMLVFEAVDWIARRNAWRLPEEVAAAIGRFYRAGVRPGLEGGFTHGDLAPWNLLRTREGWALIDWADARADGPPFYDVLHHLVQSHALLGRPTQTELIEGLAGRGEVAKVIEAYAKGAGLDPADAIRHLPRYLDTSERWLLPGPDRVRGEAARADLRSAIGGPAA